MDFWSIFITRMTQDFYSPMKCFSDSVSLWYLSECVGKHTLLSRLLGNQERTSHLCRALPVKPLGCGVFIVCNFLFVYSTSSLLESVCTFSFLLDKLYFSHCLDQIPDQKLLERKDLFGLTVCRDTVYPSGRGTAARVQELVPLDRSGSRERWVGEGSRLLPQGIPPARKTSLPKILLPPQQGISLNHVFKHESGRGESVLSEYSTSKSQYCSCFVTWAGQTHSLNL